MSNLRRAFAFLGLPFVIFLVLMYGATVGNILQEAYRSVGVMGALGDDQALAFQIQLMLAQKSSVQALVSTLLAAILALLLGFLVPYRWLSRHSKKLEFFLVSFYLMPTMVVVSLALWGLPQSFLYGWGTVVLVHVLWNTSWILHGVIQERQAVPARQREMAQILGANAWQLSRELEWTRVRPLFGVRCLEVYILCFCSMGVVTLLGGGPPVETLETAIYTYVRTSAFDFGLAARVACVQILFLIPAVVLWVRLRHGTARKIEQATVRDGFARILFFVGLSLVSILLWHLDSEGKTAAFHSAFAALGCGLGVGLVLLSASFLMMSMGGLESGVFRWIAHLLSYATALPMVLSPLVLGLGFMLATVQWGEQFDFLEGSLWAVALLQTALFWPYGWRLLIPVLGDSSRWGRLESAAVLGANPVRAWWEVEWPRMQHPLLQAMALACGLSFGEYSVASFFGGSKRLGLSSLVGSRMGQYRFEEAHLLVGVIFLVSVLLWIGVSAAGPARGEK